MAFRLVRRTRIVMLMVPACPEFGFLDVPLGRRPLAEPVLSWSCRMNVLAAIAGRYQWPQEPVGGSRVPGSTPEAASHRAAV